MKKLINSLFVICCLLCPATSKGLVVDNIYYHLYTEYTSYSANHYAVVTGCSSELKSLYIRSTVTDESYSYKVIAIGSSAFSGRNDLTSVTLPSSLETIDNNAFNGCSGLDSIDIPDHVESIGQKAFKDCSGLKKVEMPYYLMTIGDNAFEGCSGITSLNFYRYIMSIGSSAFDGCSSLADVTIPNSVTSIGSGAFKDCTGLKSVTISNSISVLSMNVFKGCISLKSVVIPNSITSIGEYAFYGCSELETISVPNTVSSIGIGAFDNTAWYNNQPDGLVYAGLVAYKYKGTMPIGTSIVINEGTHSITTKCFYCCSGLSAIYIPNSVTAIGEEESFFGCDNLVFIDCNAVIPPSIYPQTFSPVIYSNAILNVPISSYELYVSHEIWKKFWEKIDFGEEQGAGGFSGSGSGTETDPFLIFNPIQLYNVRNYIGHEGVVFKLMADIDLTEFLQDNDPIQGWEPIGGPLSPFKGVFYGEGHTIRGMFINRQTDEYVGFFGCMQNALVCNLKIKDASIQGGAYSATLVGGVKNSSFSNIESTDIVSGNNYTGGIIGLGEDVTVVNCKHVGMVSGSEIFTGGFAGYLKGSITSSYHIGDVSGINYTGGFIGFGAGVTLTDDISSGGMNVSNHAGGFAGLLTNSDVNRCQTETSLSGCSHLGGFTGDVINSNINECYALGQINASEGCNGGFVGYADGEVSIEKSGAVINLTGTPASNDSTSFIGGIVGLNDGGLTIENCFAVGDLTASGSGVGGIVGTSNGTTDISDSYYNGKISGVSLCGGIIGDGNNVTLNRNYASGSIMGNKMVGGIVGALTGSSTVNSCVAIQDVINAVAGQIGRIYGNASGRYTIGASGTSFANKAMTTMSVVSEGNQLQVVNGEQHGTSIGKGMLKYKSSYQGLGWDFTTNWTIIETECYPYKLSQCAPPVILSAPVSGATSLNGKCAQGAQVYITIGEDTYEAIVNGTTWNVTLPAMQSGTIIKAHAVADSLLQSYYVTTVVGYEGNGTEVSPYLIYTANDLANINSYSYYKVMNDIDLTDWIDSNSPITGWIPVGLSTGGTMKQLDGNNKTISGLWTNSNTSNVGLLSTTENATIKDLSIVISENKSLTSNCDNVGAVVGKAIGSTFRNIHVTGSVSGCNYTAGIAGNNDGCTFENCEAIHIQVNSNGDYAGGIAGIGTNCSFTNCRIKTATIHSLGNYVGGLVGKTTAIVNNCLADVNITGMDYIGGITGHSNSMITCCKVMGNIESFDLANCRAGGIAGYTSGNIANCYSEAHTVGGLYAGGIAGYSFGSIDNCYSCGDLYATNFAGGIVGYLDGENAAVNNCFAINNKIEVSDQSGIAMRVIGGFKNGAAIPQANNYALKTMVVSVNDVTQIIYDDLLEGISLTNDLLKQQVTYEAQGWDFSQIWGIDEANTYPYLLAFINAGPDYSLGDVNGDGEVDVRDITALIDVIMNSITDNPRADVDGNDEIDVRDITELIDIIMNS